MSTIHPVLKQKYIISLFALVATLAGNVFMIATLFYLFFIFLHVLASIGIDIFKVTQYVEILFKESYSVQAEGLWQVAKAMAGVFSGYFYIVLTVLSILFEYLKEKRSWHFPLFFFYTAIAIIFIFIIFMIITNSTRVFSLLIGTFFLYLPGGFLLSWSSFIRKKYIYTQTRES